MKISTTLILTLILIACAAPGDNLAQKRANLMKMHNDTLSDLYEVTPYAKGIVRGARGYGVFSNAQVNFVLAAAGTGNGVVIDNSSGARTYMKMGEAGIGYGLGLKDFRTVFVFHTEKALTDFVEKGWQFGAEADAAAIASDKGAEISRGVSLGDTTVYQMTESGLVLQVTLKGIKFWKDPELN